MMEAGWSARRVARQLGCFNCVVRRCWDQWIREISFTPRPGLGRLRPTCRREVRYIVRNVRGQTTDS
ncbi:transposable element Tcb2 transposase [Trichonephila clavipes]|nr:transposable element Tcb2 transposase [Trichonephila clavipes]